MTDPSVNRRNLLLTLAAGSVSSSTIAQGRDAQGRDIAMPGPAGQFEGLSGKIATPTAFGAKGDMVNDDTAALQACIDTGLPVLIPDGRFRITRPLEVKPGQIIAGLARPDSATGAAIINLTPGGGCLWYTRDSDTGRRPMPMISNIYLSADFPIRFNDPEHGKVDDAGRSNIPYGVAPIVRGCKITARTRGIGTGIAWTKMFDGVIEDCEIDGFSTNILLQGCDLNAVRHNRSVLAARYHVLDLSVLSFGSQNIIEHNDFLQAGSEACIFLKSTARHARIRDNYLEHGLTGSDDGRVRSLLGFIDASSVQIPKLGINGGGERFTTVIVDNRIDGIRYARDFVYRYEPGGQTWGEIIDPGTTGEPPAAGTAYLRLIDSRGSTTDAVPLLFNEVNAAAFHFRSPGFGRWNGYRSYAEPSLKIDGSNAVMFGAGLYGGGTSEFLRARGSRIVIANGLPGRARFTFAPDDDRFVPGHEYRVSVYARAVAGTEMLTVGLLEGERNGETVTLPLGPRFARVDLNLVAPMNGAERFGLFLMRSGNGGEIEIQAIEFAKRFIDERPRAVGATAMLRLSGTDGDVIVEVDDGAARRASAIYRIVGDRLLPIAAVGDDERALAIRANWRSPDVSVVVTGTASTKAIRIGRSAT